MTTAIEGAITGSTDVVKRGSTAARVRNRTQHIVDPAEAGLIGPVDALIDTGADSNNYISEAVAGMCVAIRVSAIILRD